MAMIMNE